MCIPEILNVFDNLNVPKCNSSQGDINLDTFFGIDSSIPEFKCGCLDPCDQQTFKYQVCTTKNVKKE